MGCVIRFLIMKLANTSNNILPNSVLVSLLVVKNVKVSASCTESIIKSLRLRVQGHKPANTQPHLVYCFRCKRRFQWRNPSPSHWASAFFKMTQSALQLNIYARNSPQAQLCILGAPRALNVRNWSTFWRDLATCLLGWLAKLRSPADHLGKSSFAKKSIKYVIYVLESRG